MFRIFLKESLRNVGAVTEMASVTTAMEAENMNLIRIGQETGVEHVMEQGDVQLVMGGDILDNFVL